MTNARNLHAALGGLLALSTALAACAPAAAPAQPAAQQPAAQGAAKPAEPAKPLTTSDFKRPELLLETDKLAGMMADKNLRIVDLRAPNLYTEAHIPGAVNLNSNDLDVKKASGVQDLNDPAKVAEVLGNLGIGSGNKVVLYDDQKTLSAARVFWVLDYLGHKDAVVLNGGYPKWAAEKRDVTRTVPRPDKAVFTPKPDPTKVADDAYVAANMGEKSVVFCDARTPEEFEGSDVRAERGGHIPGAKNINWEDNVTKDGTPIMKEASILKKQYDDAGITPDKEVVTYCQTGVRAAQAYYVLKLLGYVKVRNYDGSWQEWAKDTAKPIKAGKDS